MIQLKLRIVCLLIIFSTYAYGQENIITDVNKDKDCVCVPYYQCKNKTIITTGETLIDIQDRLQTYPIKDLKVKPKCDISWYVCCYRNTSERLTMPRKNGPSTSSCGEHNPNGIGSVVKHNNQNLSQYGEFPWMVTVLSVCVLDCAATTIYECGGSLIHTEAVLTAAHCVSDKSKLFKIRAGDWDIRNNNELYPYQERDVKTILVHPYYYRGPLLNDIAILILDKPVTIAKNIGIICLPPPYTPIENARCLSSGWGKDSSGTYPSILKKLDLPMVNRTKCQEELRKTYLGKYFQLHENSICAGGEEGKDTCSGDGGSPLVCTFPGKKDQFYQAGIVSWGIGCGTNQLPGIYVNVAKYRDWIIDQFFNNNLH